MRFTALLKSISILNSFVSPPSCFGPLVLLQREHGDHSVVHLYNKTRGTVTDYYIATQEGYDLWLDYCCYEVCRGNARCSSGFCKSAFTLKSPSRCQQYPAGEMVFDGIGCNLQPGHPLATSPSVIQKAAAAYNSL